MARSRKTIACRKVEKFKEIGFDAVQFHDDDAVPDMNDLTDAQIERAREVKKILITTGWPLICSSRLWMDPELLPQIVRQRIRNGGLDLDIANELM